MYELHLHRARYIVTLLCASVGVLNRCFYRYSTFIEYIENDV